MMLLPQSTELCKVQNTDYSFGFHHRVQMKWGFFTAEKEEK